MAPPFYRWVTEDQGACIAALMELTPETRSLPASAESILTHNPTAPQKNEDLGLHGHLCKAL